MRKVFSLFTGLGDWLMSLTDRARLQLVLAALLILIGGGIYKLIVSIERFNDPLPAASPEELIKPLEQLYNRTQNKINSDSETRQREASRLDSLAQVYSNRKISPQ